MTSELDDLKAWLRGNYATPEKQIFSVWLRDIEALQRDLAETHELYYKRSEDYARTERERDALQADKASCLHRVMELASMVSKVQAERDAAALEAARLREALDREREEIAMLFDARVKIVRNRFSDAADEGDLIGLKADAWSLSAHAAMIRARIGKPAP